MVLAALLHRLLLRRFNLAAAAGACDLRRHADHRAVCAPHLGWLHRGYGYAAALDGNSAPFGTVVPTYRLFLIGVAIVLAGTLWLLSRRRSWAAPARASVDDEEIARSIGIDVDRLATMLFAFTWFSGRHGWRFGAPLLGGYPGVEWEILTLTLIVVVVGGLGSIAGAFDRSPSVGILWNIGMA